MLWSNGGVGSLTDLQYNMCNIIIWHALHGFNCMHVRTIKSKHMNWAPDASSALTTGLACSAGLPMSMPPDGSQSHRMVIESYHFLWNHMMPIICQHIYYCIYIYYIDRSVDMVMPEWMACSFKTKFKINFTINITSNEIDILKSNEMMANHFWETKNWYKLPAYMHDVQYRILVGVPLVVF